MESKIKHISEDENTIELESGITVVAVADDSNGCSLCCFAKVRSYVCMRSVCTATYRKDKIGVYFKVKI
jgi:hypothetical protein